MCSSAAAAAQVCMWPSGAVNSPFGHSARFMPILVVTCGTRGAGEKEGVEEITKKNRTQCVSRRQTNAMTDGQKLGFSSFSLFLSFFFSSPEIHSLPDYRMGIVENSFLAAHTSLVCMFV